MKNKTSDKFIIILIVVILLAIFKDPILITIYNKKAVGVVERTLTIDGGQESAGKYAEYVYTVDGKEYKSDSKYLSKHVPDMKIGKKFTVEYFPYFPSIHLARFKENIAQTDTLPSP